MRLHLYNKLKYLLLVTCLAAGNTAASQLEGVTYDPVNPNPSYDAVSKLPFRAPEREFKYGTLPDQYGLLWLPKDHAKASKPVIVLVHGGCWLTAYNIDHTFALATALSEAGYPVWNLEYRRADEKTSAWPTSLEDLQRGILALQEVAPEKLWTNGVVIMGHSAGGHLALLLAANAERFAPQTTPNVSVIGLAAITDISHYAEGDNSCQLATETFMGASPDVVPQQYAAANPALLKIDIPITLLHGEADEIVPLEQFESMRAENIARVIEPGAGHFDWVHPGTPAFQTILKTLMSMGSSRN